MIGNYFKTPVATATAAATSVDAQSKQSASAKPSSAVVPDDDKDSKQVTPERMKAALMHAFVYGKGSKGSKAFPIKLVINGSTSSGSNANNVFAVAVQPSASSEFSSLAALFNEFRVKSCTIMFLTAVTPGTTSNATFCGVAYDPINSSSLVGVQSALEYSSNKVWVVGTSTFPAAVDASGFYKFSPRLPPGDLSANLPSTVVVARDQWTPTSSSGSACGYCKFFVPALGAGVTSMITWFMTINCEFRVRQ